jgi:hypothetical protein
MKRFIICLLVVITAGVCALKSDPLPSKNEAVDPFAPGRRPHQLTAAAWEMMITDPNRFDGQAIVAAGCIRVDEIGGRFRMQLYKDQESMRLNRQFTSIDLPDAGKFIDRVAPKDMIKWILLDGENVELQGIFKTPEDETSLSIGALVLPYEIIVVGKRTHKCVISDPEAQWPTADHK